MSRLVSLIALSWRVARGWLLAEATAVATVVGALVWLMIDAGPEPVFVGVVALVGLIGTGSQRSRLVSGYRGADQTLLDEFVTLLPTDGTIGVLRGRGLPPSWPSDLLDPLHELDHRWRDAEREFLDPDLERLKLDLLANVGALLGYVAFETFVVGDHRQGIPPEWEDTQSERYLRVTGELIKKGDLVVASHQALIRAGRRRLVD
jgi:hypothetical protein